MTISFYNFTPHILIIQNTKGMLHLIKTTHYDFHSCTVHLDVIKVFHLPTDTQYSCFKRILKFTLKQLLHVSV